MKKIDVILMCYGKDALERNFEIKEKGLYILKVDNGENNSISKKLIK